MSELLGNLAQMSTFTLHQRNTCTVSQDYECSQCSEYVMYTQSLKKHMLRHAPDSQAMAEKEDKVV